MIPTLKGRPEKYERGTQITYCPDHVILEHGFIVKGHQDIEHGFVSCEDQRTGHVWCRFFRGSTLRTKANSELCRKENIRVNVTRPQSIIDKLLEKYCNYKMLEAVDRKLKNGI